jgi:hypothetical protein
LSERVHGHHADTVVVLQGSNGKDSEFSQWQADLKRREAVSMLCRFLGFRLLIWYIFLSCSSLSDFELFCE